MADFRKILALAVAGESYTQIVAQCRCSRREVSAAKKAITARQLTQAMVAELSDDDLASMFPDRRRNVSASFHQPDFKDLVNRLKHSRHLTLLEGWRMYLATPSSASKKYSYSQFCQNFADYLDRHDLTAVLRHIPGKAMHVDWAGDTVPVVDPVTGTAQPVHFFIAVLPYSGMLHVTASLDTTLDAWIDCHIKALRYFGAVPALIIPDNASTATFRPVAKDPARQVIERYREFADFYSTAIVPARVRAPRDKASVENGVGITYSRILGFLEQDVLTAITQVNELVAERVAEINHELRRADGTTRFERFMAEERDEMTPLPALDFTTVSWKELKVQRNYHITCDYQHYSVPYQLAGRRLRVRLTPSQVTIFDRDTIVAEHPRLTGRKGQYATHLAHAPESHRTIADLWSARWFTDKAATFGPATVAVITAIIDRHAIEAQSYLTCQNILAGLGKKSRSGLEQACQQVLDAELHPSYSTIKKLQAAILDQRRHTSTPPDPAASPATSKPNPTRTSTHTFLRGAGSYAREDR